MLPIPGAKTIKKNTNSTQKQSQTHCAKQYEVTSFLSTDCELSTETCSKNVYSLGPWLPQVPGHRLLSQITFVLDDMSQTGNDMYQKYMDDMSQFFLVLGQFNIGRFVTSHICHNFSLDDLSQVILFVLDDMSQKKER